MEASNLAKGGWLHLKDSKIHVLDYSYVHFPMTQIFYTSATLGLTREQRYLYSLLLRHYG